MTKIRAFEFIAPEEWRFTHRAKVQLSFGRAKEYETRNFHFENLEHHIPEYLRQWLLRELVETYGFAENLISIDEFLTTKEDSKIAPIVIKNAAGKTGKIVALAAIGNAGESDFDFAQACQKLQRDLDAVPTAVFGLVTDGKNLACLAKSDENIADYKTLEDFPTFDELNEFIETGRFPNLDITTQKFQKLPQPKTQANRPKTAATNRFAFFSGKPQNKIPQTKPKKNRLVRPGFLLCLLLILFGIGLMSRYALQNPQAQRSNQIQTIDAKASDTAAPNLAPEKSTNLSKNSSDSKFLRSADSKKRKKSTATVINSDGATKLSAEELTIMKGEQTINPNAKTAQSKVSIEPVSKPENESLPDNRKIIRQPYLQPN